MKYLLLFISTLCMAQRTPQYAAEKLYDAIYNIDIEGILALSCLEITPENYDKLDQVFQNEDRKIRYSLTHAKYTIGEPKEIGGKSWRLITYRNVLRITYFKKLSDEEVASTKELLRQTYNAQSINYESNRNAYLIVYPAKLLAVSEGDMWKVVIADNTFLSDMFDICIPKEVKGAFGL